MNVKETYLQSSWHTLHAYKTRMIGLQCVQRASALLAMLVKYDMLAMFVKSYDYRRGSKQKSVMEVRYTAN